MEFQAIIFGLILKKQFSYFPHHELYFCAKSAALIHFKQLFLRFFTDMQLLQLDMSAGVKESSKSSSSSLEPSITNNRNHKIYTLYQYQNHYTLLRRVIVVNHIRHRQQFSIPSSPVTGRKRSFLPPVFTASWRNFPILLCSNKFCSWEVCSLCFAITLRSQLYQLSQI